MAKLRYENLKLLLNDMEKKEWVIDSFSFKYNAIDVIAILKRYKEKEKNQMNMQKQNLNSLSVKILITQ
ncbi:DUF6037 family protein [Fusobacterium ulcerans]|uniref:DUF6037 family protein n=1 Tax=Fusobacterium ulcerans TaxID=861 RepID=UPI003FEE64F6